VFAPGKPFQPSHIIAGKVGAYPSEAALRCFTIDTLGWKVLPSTNYLAYYENS
jgi:hypothetical protein